MKNSILTDEPFKVVSIPQEKSFFNQRWQAPYTFPLTLTPVDEKSNKLEVLLNWLKTHETVVDELLSQHRGILFRGFGAETSIDFDKIVVASGYNGMEYVGGAAVRTQLTPRVFTANESPPSEKIPFHHEMAQTPHPPTHLFFFCEVPPDNNCGGETPILPSADVCRVMFERHESFMRAIEEKGVRYIRFMPTEDDPTSAIGRGWKSTFNCQSKAEAEEALRKIGSDFEWLSDGSESKDSSLLKTTTAILPAVIVDAGERRSNEKIFFNSLVAAYTGWNDSRNSGAKAVVTGDGAFLDASAVEAAASIMDDLAVSIPWQQGDLLLLDNRTVMHSRKPFIGKRRILASLVRHPER